MIVSISTNVDRFFRQRLELLKNFPPYNKLRARELDVLAAIQKGYYINSKLEKHQIHPIVFSYDNMLKIREDLKISEAVLNNNKMFLRKNNFITSKQLLDNYIVRLDNPYDTSLDFTFIIN